MPNAVTTVPNRREWNSSISVAEDGKVLVGREKVGEVEGVKQKYFTSHTVSVGSIAMSLSVCLPIRTSLKNHMSKIHEIFCTYVLKPNSITLAGSEPAPNYSSELAPNMFGDSCEPASVMEFGF